MHSPQIAKYRGNNIPCKNNGAKLPIETVKLIKPAEAFKKHDPLKITPNSVSNKNMHLANNDKKNVVK